jgi:energy-coupling factor transport system substrate-specific component
MLAAGWVGFGAGCLPPMRGFPERLLLAAYGVVSALLYGLLINFWFWPFVGSTTAYSFVPGLGTIANLHRFILFDLTTSLGFDLTRAVTCAILILVLGRPVLAALRRASRRAAFEPQIDFVEDSVPTVESG